MSIRAGFAILGLLVLAGCAGKPPDPVPVKGNVTCDGKPLNGVVVTFWPEDKGRRSASAICDSTGKFSLHCVSGWYKVTVSPNLQGGGEPTVGSGTPGAAGGPPKQALVVPAHYAATSSTPLRIEVPAGGSDNLPVALKR
jgi:hypothetical protein